MKSRLRAAASSEVLRFLGNGLVATAIHGILAFVLVGLGGGVVIANVTGVLVASIYSFISHAIWSFRARVSLGSLWRFVVVSGLCSGVSGITGWAAQLAGFGTRLSVIAAIAVVPPISFLLHRSWTYKKV